MVTIGDDDEIRAWATVRWPDIDWSGSEVRVGAFHHVMLSADGPIMRGAVGLGHAFRVARELAVAKVVAGLGLKVPVPAVLDGPVGDEVMTAVLITRAPGVHGPDREWDADLAKVYRDLLTDFGGAELGAGSSLPRPRSWCGGPEWPDLVQTVTAALSEDLQQLATQLVVAVLEIETEGQWGFVHGDFGPHNILWQGGNATSVIDFDHACLGDPAIDVAPLVGVYGADAVASIVESRLLERAMVHRSTLSLQVACAAHLIGQYALRDHGLRNFARRATDGTLYDPGGRRPGQTTAVAEVER